MAIVKLVMYGIFGVLMSFAGVSVLDQPAFFLSILSTVVAIDMLSAFR
jgi:hypothetical protein